MVIFDEVGVVVVARVEPHWGELEVGVIPLRPRVSLPRVARSPLAQPRRNIVPIAVVEVAVQKVGLVCSI